MILDDPGGPEMQSQVSFRGPEGDQTQTEETPMRTQRRTLPQARECRLQETVKEDLSRGPPGCVWPSQHPDSRPCPPGLQRINSHCLKPPSLRSFTTAATGSSCRCHSVNDSPKGKNPAARRPFLRGTALWACPGHMGRKPLLVQKKAESPSKPQHLPFVGQKHS